MSTGRKRLLASAVLIVGAGVGLAFAQTRERIAPESLLPKESLLYVGFAGSAENEEAWKQTAAYEALSESGLMDVVTKLFAAMQEQTGGENGMLGQAGTALRHVMAEGCSLAVTLGEGEGRPPIPWAVLVLHDAAPFEEGLSNLAKQASAGEINLETKEQNGRSVTRGLIPGTPGIEVGWWSEGSHLVVAAGIDAVHSALTVADGAANITANPLWQQYATGDSDFTVANVGWLDFATLRETFSDMTIPDSQNQGRPEGVTVGEVVTLLGLDGLNTFAGRSGYKGRALWSETNIDAPGPRTGLLSLVDQETFTLDDLPPLPSGSNAFGATSFDWAKTYDVLLEIGRDAEQMLNPQTVGQVDAALGQTEQFLGFNPRNDLFDALGDVHTIYADSAQIPFGLGFGVAVEVDDPDRLRESLDTLLALIQGQVHQYLSVRQVDRDDRKVVLLQFGNGAFCPSYCVSEKWLSIGLAPQTVDAFLMRVDGKLASWEPTREIRAALAEVPDEFTGISISDPRATYRLVLGLAPFLLGAAQSAITQSGMFPPGMEFPLSMADIPPAELVVRPLFANVKTVGVDENGVTCTSRVSLSGIPLAGSVNGGTTVATTGVLVALLLPAVQQAREAARRTQSRNNLKQIMLALHNYHDVHSQFPEGTHPNKDLKPAERLSWLVKILPYLDQANLYSLIDFEFGWEDAVNERPLKTIIPVYQNPSVADDHPEYPTTHYIGLAGLGEDGPELPVTSPKAGVFAYDRATHIRDITDGTSNTIAISDGSDPGPWSAGGPSTIRPLTKKPYINGPDGIGGPHQGGVQVGLADGSVRFLSEDIDPEVMEALVTINGGEVIGDF